MDIAESVYEYLVTEDGRGKDEIEKKKGLVEEKLKNMYEEWISIKNGKGNITIIGSRSLGVDLKSSDLDIVFQSLNIDCADFLQSFYQFLKQDESIESLCLVESKITPMIKLKMYEINVDCLYINWKSKNFPRCYQMIKRRIRLLEDDGKNSSNALLLNMYFKEEMANNEYFINLVKLLKLYFIKNFIYGSAFGLMPGCGICIIAGKILKQKLANDLGKYFESCFNFLSTFDWKVPLQMHNDLEYTAEGIDYSNDDKSQNSSQNVIQILSPISNTNIMYATTKGTDMILKEQFSYAHHKFMQLKRQDITIEQFFQGDFFTTYSIFLVIKLFHHTEQELYVLKGCLKSRIGYLFTQLEGNDAIQKYHPYPRELQKKIVDAKRSDFMVGLIMKENKTTTLVKEIKCWRNELLKKTRSVGLQGTNLATVVCLIQSIQTVEKMYNI